MSNIQLMTKLSELQTEFKAPKTERNDHGGFMYRTLEKMEEKLKPLLAAKKATILFTDDVVEAGGRPHIKATVTLFDLESDATYSVSAVAQEAEIQKGMQAAQISGSTSSYARKYALSGLLLVDDSEELDGKKGDQTDWESEIESAKDVRTLLDIFKRMDGMMQKKYTDRLTERRREVEEHAG